ncbi:acyl-CoA N-acyltransferase [Thamnocephalis sphaerospora]|uniref:N-alpha-acetyltransferase 40 n=1 Tax=Thamnocephalis sphaerospora TaxID=78915 RepID=A0A4P9XPV1_9FUNG|nr:acyl-CoA N-acyltransferase [Thamnocephalis sphaerospora]|eukprot:RKP08043.1 acyl-CoA N-acyltransferase [Thamnocephalis sphaerospora]
MAAGWPWDEAEKRSELFDAASRFLIVRTRADTAEKSAENLGYAMYRFDTEEQMKSDAMVPVVYCYELQVAAEARGQGVGRMLMETLERIGQAWQMSKVMLTVLKGNKDAIKFYKALGYAPDEISPDQILPKYRAKRYNYYILSRRMAA